MSVASDRLQFLYENLSEREISRQTGIARSTLYDIKKGFYEVSERFYTTIRNAFQRTAYQQLREAGMDTIKSEKYKWYSVSTVRETIGRMKSVVNYLTDSNIASALKRAERKGEAYDRDIIYENLRERIKENLRKSHETLEALERYL